MNEPISESCKLCGAPSSRETNHFEELCVITGCRCGGFSIDRSDYDDCLALDRWQNEASRRELSALLREQAVQHGRPILLQIEVKTRQNPIRGGVALSYDELAATWPQSVAERLDRVLLNLAALSPTGGAVVLLINQSGRDLALVFARTEEEACYHVKALIDQKRASEIISDRVLGSVCVTPAGWARVSDLESSSGSRNNPPFVAMWYGGDENKVEMDAVFQAICGACKAAGWRMPIRADSEQHNDFIMDKILGDIRRSPFVIADFTGNRNGVYIEAGFARGLRKPVVHTCRADHFEQAHFDIRQINAIKWTSLDELREGVTQRIRGTEIGDGPKPVPNPPT